MIFTVTDDDLDVVFRTDNIDDEFSDLNSSDSSDGYYFGDKRNSYDSSSDY